MCRRRWVGCPIAEPGAGNALLVVLLVPQPTGPHRQRAGKAGGCGRGASLGRPANGPESPTASVTQAQLACRRAPTRNDLIPEGILDRVCGIPIGRLEPMRVCAEGQ